MPTGSWDSERETLTANGGVRPDDPLSVHVQRISVSYEYPVYFTSGVFSVDNPALVEAVCRMEPSRRHRLFVVVDRAVAGALPELTAEIGRYAEHHQDRLDLVDEPLVITGGEEVKNDPSYISFVQGRLNELRMDRQSFVVIVGGGAIQDTVGYAAATVHRGLRVIRVPTTVLAQDDSGVGVKNGINAFAKKNFLGTFAPPFAILNDDRFLETLARREKIVGMAEAVKVALIRDKIFFGWLEENSGALAACEPQALRRLIRRGAQLHLDHIATSGDPFEFGSARPLDFGHWAAHRLETLSESRLRHGEAVAIGMAIDSLYSQEVGMLDGPSLERVLVLLESLGFRLWDETLTYAARDGRPLVLDGLREFREHLGGELTVTLLREIGRGIEVHEIQEDLMLRSIERLRLRDSAR